MAFARLTTQGTLTSDPVLMHGGPALVRQAGNGRAACDCHCDLDLYAISRLRDADPADTTRRLDDHGRRPEPAGGGNSATWLDGSFTISSKVLSGRTPASAAVFTAFMVATSGALRACAVDTLRDGSACPHHPTTAIETFQYWPSLRLAVMMFASVLCRQGVLTAHSAFFKNSVLNKAGSPYRR